MILDTPVMTETDNSLSKEIVLANSYIKNGAFGEARKILEKLVFAGQHQSFLYLALGDVCRAQCSEESTQKAIQYYKTALKLTLIDQDNQVKVAARAGLVWIYLKKAHDEFNALGQADQWEELKSILPEVKEEPKFATMMFAGLPCNCTTSAGLRGRMKDGQCKATNCIN